MKKSDREVALVTGGAKRVGRMIALRLAQAGYDVAFTYLASGDDAKSLCKEIAGVGRRSLAIKADLTKPRAATEAIYKAHLRAFGSLKVLVNNASLYAPDNPKDEKQAGRFWGIHVESPLLLSRRFAKLLASAQGAIVNMVDLMAERPIPGYATYSASKAGLVNITRSLARELAPEIRVNGIAPGVVEWPAGYPVADQNKYLKRVPLARAGTPQDVADAVIFFCHSNYCTGQVLRLDGGRSIS